MKMRTLSEFGTLLQDIVSRLIDHPEDLEVRELVGEQATLFEILVRQSDHGKVLGRKGVLIDALRQVCVCVGGREGRTYSVVMVEDGPSPDTRQSQSVQPSSIDDPIADTNSLLIRIVESLVDAPDLVQVQALEGHQTTIFEVSVERSDIKRMLGRQGKTADAVRRLLFSMGARESRRYLLEVLEPLR